LREDNSFWVENQKKEKNEKRGGCPFDGRFEIREGLVGESIGESVGVGGGEGEGEGVGEGESGTRS